MLVAPLLVTVIACADGVDDEEDFINYAFATWIGSGVYKMHDRNLTILRAPLSWQFREAEIGKTGYKALLPVTLGIHDSTDFDDRVGSLSFVPGLAAASKVTDGGNKEKFTKIDIGIDAGRTTRIRMFNKNLVVNAFYTLSYFANDAEFPQQDDKTGKIHILHEIGLTFSGKPELDFAGISGLQGGFGYMFGSNSFQGLSFNAGFPF